MKIKVERFVIYPHQNTLNEDTLRAEVHWRVDNNNQEEGEGYLVAIEAIGIPASEGWLKALVEVTKKSAEKRLGISG